MDGLGFVSVCGERDGQPLPDPVATLHAQPLASCVMSGFMPGIQCGASVEPRFVQTMNAEFHLVHWLRQRLIVSCACAALIACGRDEQRTIAMWQEAAQASSDSLQLINRSGALLQLLSRDDTAGLGEYLDADFRWPRYPSPQVPGYTQARVTPDPYFVDRHDPDLPRLTLPPTGQLVLQKRGDSTATVVFRHPCAELPSCEPKVSLVLRWRLTQDGWKAVSLYGGARGRNDQ